MHRQPDIHSPGLARAAAALTALVGLINVGSALTPDLRWRGRLLLSIEPMQTMKVFHALALPLAPRRCWWRPTCSSAAAARSGAGSR
jgi:hypothetical protein